MLKKIVSLVVGATLVLATLGVSAATIETVSVYEGDDIAVTTTVTGVVAGEVYTYLAYEQAEGASLENLTGTEVAYVDEKIVTAEDVTNGGIAFTYVTAADFNGATIAFGGAGAGTKDQAIEPADPTVYRNYTVKLADGEAVPDQIDITNAAATDLVDIAVDGIANVIIEAVTVGGAAIDGWFETSTGIKVPLNLIPENAEIVITAKANPYCIVGILNAAFIAKDEDVTTNPGVYDSIIAVARIEGAAAEYGIEFSKNADFSDALQFKALGKGTNGMYAVKVNGFDTKVELAGAEVVYARAYATGFEDGYVAPVVREIVIPADAPVEG